MLPGRQGRLPEGDGTCAGEGLTGDTEAKEQRAEAWQPGAGW